MNSGDVREAANEIASFLQAHPESADTIEGIHHWWLHPDRGYSMEVVARALELLKLELVVECFHIGPRVVWRRRRRID